MECINNDVKAHGCRTSSGPTPSGSELQESKQLSSCGSMCTDRKQPLNLPVMRMGVWIRHVYCNYDIGIYTDQSKSR